MHRLAKPTNGHPTQTAAILALHAEGIVEAEIAARLDVPVNTVRARVYQAGRAPNKGRGTKKRVLRPVAPRAADDDRGGRPVTTVDLNYDVARQLRPFASRHGTKVTQIAREIVEAAVEQGLVERLLEGRF